MSSVLSQLLLSRVLWEVFEVEVEPDHGGLEPLSGLLDLCLSLPLWERLPDIDSIRPVEFIQCFRALPASLKQTNPNPRLIPLWFLMTTALRISPKGEKRVYMNVKFKRSVSLPAGLHLGSLGEETASQRGCWRSSGTIDDSLTWDTSELWECTPDSTVSHQAIWCDGLYRNLTLAMAC